jgi:hypothetical protein
MDVHTTLYPSREEASIVDVSTTSNPTKRISSIMDALVTLGIAAEGITLIYDSTVAAASLREAPYGDAAVKIVQTLDADIIEG